MDDIVESTVSGILALLALVVLVGVVLPVFIWLTMHLGFAVFGWLTRVWPMPS